MDRTFVASTLYALALLALAPMASADTPYNVCAPGGAVCFVQESSPYAGQECDQHAYNYGGNVDRDALLVNAAGASAKAGGQDSCANYHYADYDAHGVFAHATANGVTANAAWYRYDNDYHWTGAPQDNHGEYVTLTVTDGSGPTGVTWKRTVVTDAPTSNTCDTTLYVRGSSTSLGCGAGLPPSPPNLPWGDVLP